MFADMLSFYTIVAAEHPQLEAVCRRTRARVCWGIAGWYLRRGEKENAIPYLREALTHVSRSRLVADRLIAMMPDGRVLQGLMNIRRKVRSAMVAVRGRCRRLTN